jgi:6-phosphofructokinase
MSDLLTFLTPADLPSSKQRLLVLFDGGNAPGYSSVAVALTEEGARRGFEVWAATEGFRSLTSDARANPRFERLIVGRGQRYALLAKGVPARSMARRVQDPGSDFRSERYVAFHDADRRKEALATLAEQRFTHVIGVGGNGTFSGLTAMLATAPSPVGFQIGFVNVSIDNDVGGDRAIGFFSGVEAGATIARGLLEDAYTHKRIYLLEMMGNRSGRHALHCGVAARAHLTVLPRFRLPDAVLEEIARALEKEDYALVVVAEGYERDRRDELHPRPSASAFFKSQLEEQGLVDAPHKRIIAEPFSRYLRGVRPGFADVSASYLKASLLLDAFERGETEVMPYVRAAHDVGVLAFEAVTTENRVEPAFLPLLDRLHLPGFRTWIRDHFTTAATTATGSGSATGAASRDP